MPRVELPITNGFYVSRSLPISAQECDNLYVHLNQRGGLAERSLFGTPGISQLTTTGTVAQINRGAHVKDGIPYFVNGTSLYRLNQTFDGNGNEVFTTDDLGTIPGDGRVAMSDNGTQLCILVPGVDGYIYNENAGTPFQQITDPDFKANGNPLDVVFLDGYFVFSTDEKKIIVSNLNDGLAYTATDVGTAEADPDGITGLAVKNNQLYVIGTETIEVLRNVGGTGFPFLRIDGAGINVGSFAAHSIINVAGTFMWIGGATNEKPQVFVFSEGREQKVSHDGIDTVLESFTETEISEAFAFTYSENGAKFVGWTLPTKTIVYDLTSGEWHTRSSYTVEEGVGTKSRWRVNSLVKAYERIIVADKTDGRIGEMDLDIYDEYGNEIIRVFATLPFSNRGGPIVVPMLELTMEAGVGMQNTAFDDPVVALERSVDGKLWGDKQYRKIGKVGEYYKRTQWWRNGFAARLEVFRFTVTAPIKVVIIKLEADIE